MGIHSLHPDHLQSQSVERGHKAKIEIATFTNQRDRFIQALVYEVKRQHTLGGGLAPEYCEAMSAALARYLCARYGSRDVKVPGRPIKLPLWRLRWLTEYVDSHIDRAISVPKIADEIGISAGHLHRAFRLTTGETLLTFINRRRIQHAQRLLVTQNLNAGELAPMVGFLSPTHFARIFRRYVGMSPSAYRQGR
jgi:AraC family transcriptional regulator